METPSYKQSQYLNPDFDNTPPAIDSLQPISSKVMEHVPLALTALLQDEDDDNDDNYHINNLFNSNIRNDGRSNDIKTDCIIGLKRTMTDLNHGINDLLSVAGVIDSSDDVSMLSYLTLSTLKGSKRAKNLKSDSTRGSFQSPIAYESKSAAFEEDDVEELSLLVRHDIFNDIDNEKTPMRSLETTSGRKSPLSKQLDSSDLQAISLHGNIINLPSGCPIQILDHEEYRLRAYDHTYDQVRDSFFRGESNKPIEDDFISSLKTYACESKYVNEHLVIEMEKLAKQVNKTTDNENLSDISYNVSVPTSFMDEMVLDNPRQSFCDLTVSIILLIDLHIIHLHRLLTYM